MCVNVFISRPIHECLTFITKLHAYLNLPTAFEIFLLWTRLYIYIWDKCRSSSLSCLRQ